MKIVEKKNVTEQVVEYLKSNIQRGVWAPGEKIASENELTEELKVSRASVRYAIQHLVAIGVLESFQGKGTYVKSLPVEDISRKFASIYNNSDMVKLVEFRCIMEVEACRLGAKRIDQAGLNHLKICLANMMTHVDDTESFIQDDMEFHQWIFYATENPLIVKCMECMLPEINAQHHQFNTEATRKSAIEFHKNILAAMEAHDGEEAAREMSNHLMNLRKNIA